jgi:hypothetical protein
MAETQQRGMRRDFSHTWLWRKTSNCAQQESKAHAKQEGMRRRRRRTEKRDEGLSSQEAVSGVGIETGEGLGDFRARE